MSTTQYQAVIGLEVHAQLSTKTKIFGGAPTGFGARPNSQVSEGCWGMPGTLPVLNREAVTLAIRAGLALGCAIQERSVFDRKSYFYPDLPTGYQISQYADPICLGGGVPFEVDGVQKFGALNRIHLEQDAGKSVHMPEIGKSAIDLNRAGAALVEIVSEPVLHSADEAVAYLRELRAILVAMGVNDGNMNEGKLRCDANISVRPVGQKAFGVRAEVKNLNSFRNLRDAINYEIRRHIETIEAGGQLVQETRLWNDERQMSFSMRRKETMNDYRYFPDPDIPPLNVDRDWIEAVRATLPELPAAARKRLQNDVGLSEYDANLVVDTPAFTAIVDQAIDRGANAKTVVNLLSGPILAAVNDGQLVYNDEDGTYATGEGVALRAQDLAELAKMQDEATLSPVLARKVLDEILRSGRTPAQVVEQDGLRQSTDSSEIDGWIDEAFKNAAAEVEAWRGGRKKVLGVILGHVMRASGARANPDTVRKRLLERLEGK